MKGRKEPLHGNTIFFITVLLATLLFPGLRQTERFLAFVPSAYGIELPVKIEFSAKKARSSPEQPSAALAQKNKKFNHSESDVENRRESSRESSIVNSATCGHIWKNQLTKVQGKIRKVVYRMQPLTRRSGLHIDLETGTQEYVVIHVFPKTLIAKCPSAFHFTLGDTVTVSGSAFFTGSGGMQQNICAATIIRKKDVLHIRDPLTGRLERHGCCQEICKKNCSGLPLMCNRMCMGNCQNMWLKAVFQEIPFCPSCDTEYAKTTFDF